MNMFSLIKAAFSQDMNLFKIRAKKNASKKQKILLPVFLFLVMLMSVFSYAYGIAQMLKPSGLTYVMLSMFVMLATMVSLIEGVYKAQGILYEAKDNDLLFSLPIKKSKILFVRILKILTFQYVFNLMILLPAFAVYVIFETPNVTFYIISFLMTILVPIIPTVVACVVGCIVKLISVKFKAKKIVQTVLTMIMFFMLLILMINYQNIVGDITQNADNISETISSIYYPIELYLNLINSFEILDLIKLLLITIIPLVLFILIASISYFKIIAKSKEHSSKEIKNIEEVEKKVKKTLPIYSLTKKELKRYLSCPTYMFNTSFGLILSVVISVLLCFKGEDLIRDVLASYEVEMGALSLNVIFYVLLIFTGVMTSITSSSISLEGKTINITKSLPISEKTILNSKILMCFVIELPFILTADLIYIIRFTPNVMYTILYFGITFVIILLSACIGLLVNLKYPKMDATSDTEVIKQSISSMISTSLGLGILVVCSGLVFGLGNIIKPEIAMIIVQSVLFIITIVLYTILMKIGPKKYRSINV